MSNKIIPVITLLLICSLNSSCQTAKDNKKAEALNARIDSILQSKVDNDEIPGAVILIKKDGRVVCEHAYGYAQKYDYNHRLITPPDTMKTDDLFDIASLTKVIGTTTSIMLLSDRGMINIDDPVCKYIKAFGTDEKKNITIRNLLTHTAGLCEWYPLYYRASDKQESYKVIAELPLAFPVGEKRHYSDLGFDLLGEIIEIVSGQPLDIFMEMNVFRPLDMKNTCFNPLRTVDRSKIAATSAGNPYERRMVYDTTLGYTIRGLNPESWNGWRTYLLRGEVNDGNAWYAFKGISGAAGLFSNAEDLQKLVDMLMNNGMAGQKQFISSGTIKKFLTKDKYNNGLGWMMDTSNSFMKNAPEGSYGHTGFTGTSITVVPSGNLSVILLINRQNTGLLNSREYYNTNSIRLQIFNAVTKYL